MSRSHRFLAGSAATLGLGVRDDALPEDPWQVEPYDLAVDVGESSDRASRHPARVAAPVPPRRSSWQDTSPRAEFGTTLTVPSVAAPGQAFTVTAALGNGSSRPWSSAALALRAPAGWTVQAITATTAGQLVPGAAFTAGWQVTPPAGAPASTPWTLTAVGTALAPGGSVRYEDAGFVTTPPRAPTRDSYLSDLTWIHAVNGRGPVERDASDGVNAGGGTPIAFGGTTYAKGLGVHAFSDVAFHLGGAGNRFTALVGIDDRSARRSSAGATRATVYGDDRVLFTSPVLTAAGGPLPVDVDVRGVRVLRLEVADADAESSFDRTSWALARVTVLPGT
ncbi:NPCBM/NEW2 domain-containing protein [Streptomyces flavochromogenes]|uniref:NPCBM/NEW2 domain-containing protein n=1 Tax=Streptomyces flavochromogenes TaxID=68199 RepID=A0ABW6XY21_9ACTN